MKSKLHGQSGQLLQRYFELIPKNVEEKFISTVFPATKIMSTYLYCFIAGDYEEIVCPLEHNLVHYSLFSLSNCRYTVSVLTNLTFKIYPISFSM